jgi:tRNA 2-thiouridine synthesizing protein E
MHTTTATARPRTGKATAIEFDQDGFLADPAAWTPELSETIARLDDIAPLTPRHWVVINYVREGYTRLGALPVMRNVCRATGMDRDTVRALFGSCITLWRVAGLPNPGEEAKAYLG